MSESFVAASLPEGVAVREWSSVVVPGGAEIRYPTPTTEFVRSLAASLRASKSALAERSVEEVIRSLGAVGERFRDPTDPIRGSVQDAVALTSGLSSPMAARVIEGMAIDWTADRLRELVRADFGDERVLDEFRPWGAGSRVDEPPARGSGEGGAMAGGRRTLVRAVSGPLALHISSGNVPGVGATSIVRSLLVKAPVVVKPGAGDVVLPVAFRDALVEIDPELAASVGVTYWPGGSAEGEDDLVMAADPVVVYGGLETIRRVRAKVPAQHRVVEYRHRFGVGVVGREALADPEDGARAARVVAIAVAMFDQRGCVSPRVVFVEEGGGVSPLAWAGQLGEALEAVEATLPQGRPTAEEASAVHQLRGAAEARAHAGGLAGGGAGGGAGEHARRGVSVLTGSGELGWTLIVDPGATPDGPAGNRTVLIVPVEDATRVPDHLRPFGGALQTVGVRGLGSRAVRIASELGAIGASRIVPFEDAPWPPATWRHDGGDPLRELVRWVEYSPGS